MVNSGQDAMARLLLEEALAAVLHHQSPDAAKSFRHLVTKIEGYVHGMQTTEEEIPQALSDDLMRDVQMCLLRYASAAWAKVQAVEEAASRRSSYKQVKID